MQDPRDRDRESEIEREREQAKEKEAREKAQDADENRDPITGEKGSHPYGTAGGGAAGAATGAAIGSIAGPGGALVGGAIGAAAGGWLGHEAAEMVNPTVEDEYWRNEYPNRPYSRGDRPYDFFEPAYRFGWESAIRPNYLGRPWDDVEPDLERDWRGHARTANTPWPEVRGATRDAYTRIYDRYTRRNL